MRCPGGLAAIGKAAFSFCGSLEAVEIPAGVEAIPTEAFAYCYQLKQITIPATVTAIGKDAFCECRYLTIRGTAGSFAESYAKKKKIPFEMI